MKFIVRAGDAVVKRQWGLTSHPDASIVMVRRDACKGSRHDEEDTKTGSGFSCQKIHVLENGLLEEEEIDPGLVV